jgi:hypothetical protein
MAGRGDSTASGAAAPGASSEAAEVSCDSSITTIVPDFDTRIVPFSLAFCAWCATVSRLVIVPTSNASAC